MGNGALSGAVSKVWNSKLPKKKYVLCRTSFMNSMECIDKDSLEKQNLTYPNACMGYSIIFQLQ